MGNNPTNSIDPSGHVRCDADGYCGDQANVGKKKNNTFDPTTDLPPADDTWGNKPKDERLNIVLGWLKYYRGSHWWEGAMPTKEEWAAWLLFMEGGDLLNRNDQVLLAQIILYKLNSTGLAGFTPVVNPDIDPSYERWNFTMNDWNKLVNPENFDQEYYSNIIGEVTSDPTFDINQRPDYLYWTDTGEMRDNGVKPSMLTGNKYGAPMTNGETFYFLQTYEDFSCATAGNCPK